MNNDEKNVRTSYKPVELDVDVNITKASPLKEFGKLLIGFTLLITVLYFLSGAIVNIIVPFIPPELEAKIWDFEKTPSFPRSAGKDQDRLDRIFAKIPADTLEKLPHYPYQIIAVKDKTINAVSLPGGKIMVFTGLMDLIKNDDELLFVIGHELGHFASRDHLHGLGRELLFTLFRTLIGATSSLVDYTQNLLSKGYSREQEMAADNWGYRILKESGGSTNAAMSFFHILQEQDGPHGKLAKMAEGLTRTHPFPEERAAKLQTLKMK